MKALLVICGLAGVAHAERGPIAPSLLEADLGSGVIGVGYERGISPKLSLRATFQLNRPWYTQYVGGDETDVAGLGLELRPFIFPFASGPAGLYVSPFGRLVAIEATDGMPEKAQGLGWSAGATVGYGWMLLEDRLLLRFGAGVQYWAFEVGDSAGVAGLFPDVDIIVGYAF